MTRDQIQGLLLLLAVGVVVWLIIVVAAQR